MSEEKPPDSFLKYASAGMQLLVVIGACAWLGLKIDQHFGLTFPVFLLSLTLLSFGGMLYKFYRSLNE